MGLHRGALGALLVFLCLVHGGREAEAAGGGGFVRAQGTRFVLNGSPYYANGFNAYWLMTMASDTAQKGKVTSALSQAAARGLTVARTWAFSDGGGNALQYSPGKYNENTFKGLDFVLSEARKVGVNVILSLVNNYDTFGGKKQYVDWARGQGQAIGSDDDFFTNSLVKGFYKNHVKTVLTRVNTVSGVAYKDDPTILAWELMNEPRCQSDLSGRSIQSWITEMAAHVKSIDANHMLEAGLEGFYGASSSLAVNPSGYLVGTDFIANNQVPGIDFATVHSYPDQWLSSSSSDDQAQLRFLGRWLDAHIADAQRTLRKPLLVAEFGKSQRDPGYSSAQRDAQFGMVYTKIYQSARAGGPTVGGLFWQLMADGMESYGDGYEVIFAEAPASTTAVITSQSRKLKMLGKALARGSGGKGSKGVLLWITR
uniref:Uncharacterized protein n=1 Tax=Avena sativa TaxID=4498 RepID=A0ACD5VI06_AVESA